MGPMGMPDISSMLSNPAMMQMVSADVVHTVYTSKTI